MKTIILSLLVIVAMTFNTQAQTTTNYIKLKGHIENAKSSVSVQVFMQDTITNTWHMTKDKEKSNNYSITLDPTHNYQIWFTNDNGITKILYHNGGNTGLWSLQLDIDFTNRNCCEIFQYEEDYALTIFEPNKEQRLSFGR